MYRELCLKGGGENLRETRLQSERPDLALGTFRARRGIRQFSKKSNQAVRSWKHGTVGIPSALCQGLESTRGALMKREATKCLGQGSNGYLDVTAEGAG